MRSYSRTLFLIIFSILADFSFRMLTKNDQVFALVFELFLFLIISSIFFYLRKRKPVLIRKVNRMELVLSYFYFFGALRALFILSGMEIHIANMIVFFLGVIIYIYHLLIKKVSL